ncbi:hypothetical protein CEXT_725551 [Caerostris extrusa]|uniref:Uncharacterized protein n=1 Tax=Caerostris extrusa TaxID=172846 RepID=A0AAV4SF65_CAEEX|nr:hypothetical protein CEXT_725551 [Caerostris extrusa]
MSEWDARHKRVILQYDNITCPCTSSIQDATERGSATTPAVFSGYGAFSLSIVQVYVHDLSGLHMVNSEVQNWMDERVSIQRCFVLFSQNSSQKYNLQLMYQMENR